MRGFRASRASQNNKSARFGRDWNPQTKNEPQYFGPGQQSQTQKPELPAWLKMPAPTKTTRPTVVEREPAVAPRLQTVALPKGPQGKRAPVEKNLRLVGSTTEKTPAVAAKATSTTKTRVKKVGVTTTRTRTTTATRKRKAAA